MRSPRYTFSTDMHPLRRDPIRAAILAASALLLTAALVLVQPRGSAGPRSVKTAAGAPAATVDDTLVAPHREVIAPPSPPPPPPPKPLGPRDALRAGILSALSGSTAAVRGVYVETEGLGKVVDSSGSAMLLPASLTKLFTGGSAMLKLGSDFRFRTEVLASGVTAPDGTLNGSLVLIAGGDPALEKAHLYELAAAIKSNGILRVSEHIYADDSRYDRLRGAPGWKPNYFPKQVGSLSALAVDHNTWRTDPGYYDNPAHGNIDLFRAVLAENGVTVAGETRLGRPDGVATLVASHDSAPLGAVLGEMLKKSDNFYAELVLKELGRSIGSPSTAGGLDLTRSVAQDLGVSRGRVFDGSGLSLDNRESAQHLVHWLQAMERSPVGETFKRSLAVACSGGTTLLEKRLCGTPAAGRVSAKTGALAQSRSLAGYTSTASGRRVWFAFILTEVATAERAWEALDSALVAITTFNR